MTRNRLRLQKSSQGRSGSILEWPLLMGALVLGTLASCDNPACVFGSTVCQTLPGGGANAVSATYPETGELVVPSSPKVDQVFPSGFVHPLTPLVLVFSESMSPSSMNGAFQLRATNGLGATASPESALIGDGRVLILSPPPLVPGQEYELFFAEDSEVRDLSGALSLQPADGVIGTFTIDEAPSTEPNLLMTWPTDGALNTSTVTEVVTVFDRPLNPLTITSTSWNVLVDGADPVFDPLPQALLISGGVASGGATISDSRVWHWSSVDTAIDSRVSLGEGANITVELSAGALKIATPEGDELEAITPEFTTAAFSPPSVIAIQSEPTDAMGIENLNGMSPLLMSLDFSSPTLEGDVLEIFIVGNNPGASEGGVVRISLQREVPLSGGTVSTFLGESELLLLQTLVPLVALLSDGDVGFGFAIRRGSERTALRVLDVDLTEDGVQDARLDLSPPEFLTLLGKEEGESVLLSDLRELSIAGFASEEPRSVEVIVQFAMSTIDNRVMGQLPPLPAFDLTGAFVAAPVAVGQIDPSEFPVAVSLIVYDRALNASEPFFIQYTQRSGSALGTSLPGSGLDVNVTVYDAVTLEALPGATVYSHESVAGAVTAFTTAPVVTDALGQAQVASAPAGMTLLTVQAPGYDSFTFQGVPTTRLDVPLVPDAFQTAASLSGVNSTGPDLASAFINNFIADSRVILPGNTLRLADSCTYNTLLDRTTCTFFPPLPIRAEERGVSTFLATKDPSNLSDPNLFSAGTFLQAFELSMPRTPVGIAMTDNVVLNVGELLSGAGVDPQDIPLGTVPQLFEKPPNFVLDFPNLVGDPLVSIEAFTPGVHGMMTIGAGRPYFDMGNDRWDIRAAYSARARAAGELPGDLAIEDERLLRVEIVDLSGNRTGVRQPMSTATGSLEPPGVALLTAPMGTTGGAAYDLVHENTLNGVQDTFGLYRALLVDSTGVRWHIWTLDPPSASGSVVTHVPPIGIEGGVALGSGAVTCFLDGWSWPGFDPEQFMFSDIARRHDRFFTASPKIFSQP